MVDVSLQTFSPTIGRMIQIVNLYPVKVGAIFFFCHVTITKLMEN